MPNILSGLNGQTAEFSIEGRKYSLQVVTDYETMKGQSQAIRELAIIADETKGQLIADLGEEEAKKWKLESSFLPRALEKQEEHIKIWSSEEELEDRGNNDINLKQNFSRNNNYTVLVCKDSDGRVVNVAALTIDDPREREALKVKKEVGAFIYVDRAKTVSATDADVTQRGKGILSKVFSTFTQMLFSNEEFRGYVNRKMSHDDKEMAIECCTGMKAMTVVGKDDETVKLHCVANLDRYAHMFSKMFDGADKCFLQPRFRSGEHDFGGEMMKLKDFLCGVTVNRDFVHHKIAENEGLIGFFIRGGYTVEKFKEFEEVLKKSMEPSRSAVVTAASLVGDGHGVDGVRGGGGGGRD